MSKLAGRPKDYIRKRVFFTIDEDAGSSIGGFDSMKKKFDIAWQVPGLPQLLLLSNFSGELFMKHKQEHPEGYSRPWEVAGNRIRSSRTCFKRTSRSCNLFRHCRESEKGINVEHDV